MNTFARTSTAALLVSLAAISATIGCKNDSSTEGGAEVKTNMVTGTVSTLLGASLDDSFDAAKWVVQDMKYTITREAEDALKGVIGVRTADDTKIEVTLTRNGEKLTNLSVNAGLTKTDVAKVITEKIQARVQ